jgi:hypothetical protein
LARASTNVKGLVADPYTVRLTESGADVAAGHEDDGQERKGLKEAEVEKELTMRMAADGDGSGAPGSTVSTLTRRIADLELRR